MSRGAFGGWDDGDARLGRLAWCLTRHLRPEFVVETGVARGLTTRVILEAMDRNGRGRLWSIDLPPLIAQELWEETAAAVHAPGVEAGISDHRAQRGARCRRHDAHATPGREDGAKSTPPSRHFSSTTSF